MADGVAHDKLHLNILDTVPVAADNNTANLTREVIQGTETLTVSQPQTYRGTAVETFGGDLEGAHVSQVTIEGAVFSFDGTTLTETAPSSMVVTYHQVTDATGTYLVATTARGETVKVNLNTGNYTVEVTGQGVAINEAPVATIKGDGGLLGGDVVSANVLGAIDLSEKQLFSVSDVNENITEVKVDYSTALGAYVANILPQAISNLQEYPLLSVQRILGETLALLVGTNSPLGQILDALLDNPLINGLGSGVNALLNGEVALS